ncbi:m7GpppN-mRNA hydrolase-like [Saccoglossus kowalevskii]|uniref:M7GpppN-mRNA hydrolase-like n=1 Tax=Saccoglossus kowalevskii TaxID=10224 RepID=A0ABM0M2A1_SACKO|nr:PREDICTED: m7GpppN-mRNA hydrolase-like [Saccoglossus kowalevskii]
MESSKPPRDVIPEEILTDLCSRFLINIPGEERADLVRVCFQIELAHWFYLDFYCIENPELPTCGIREFAQVIFRHCPYLHEHSQNVNEIIANWKDYKMSVPTHGAIIVDETLQHVLLVQGYWAKASWGFPKGKVNKDESEHQCAIREVLEETGFNISNYIDENEYIEERINEQIVRLYIIPYVPDDTKFQPKTRNEIKSVEWFLVDDLPCHKRDSTPKVKLNMSANNFFMVIPFVKPLKKWIAKKKGSGDSQELKQTKPKTSVMAATMSDNKQMTDKQLADQRRQRQQRLFAQANKNEFTDYLELKEGPGSGGVRGSLPQQPRGRGRGMTQKQYKILARDSGKDARRSLFDDKKSDLVSDVQPDTDHPFTSRAFQNFEFDWDAILKHCEFQPKLF